MLWTSDLTRIIKTLTRKPVYNDTTDLKIALSYLVKALISMSASITPINYDTSTSLRADSTVNTTLRYLIFNIS
jgi:hypothetical protein